MAVEPELLLAHADFVRSLARSLVRDENLADDVVQDTWLAALESPPRAAAKARAWLARVTRNFALLAHRGERRRKARERAAAWREGTSSTAEVIAWESTRRRVVGAVLALDEPSRSAIVLRFYHDLPPREIAARLGLPVETVRTRLKRGLARLRKALDDEHGGSRRAWQIALAPLAGLSSATAQAAVAGGSAAGETAVAGAVAALPGSTGILGGLAMSAKMKIVAAALLLLGAALVVWRVLPEDSDSTGEPSGIAAPAGIAAESRPEDGAESIAAEEAEDLDRQPVPPVRPVAGLVTDAVSGLPVAGATVILRMKNDSGKTSRAATSPRGRFVVEAGEWAGPAWLCVRSGGYRESVSRISLGRGERHDEESIAISPIWALVGRVLGPDQRAVAGAAVTAVREHGPSEQERFGRERTEWTVATDEEGRFILSSVTERREGADLPPRSIRAMKADLAAPWRKCALSEEILLRLEKSRDVRGRLAWSFDESPVAGARVRCIAGGDPLARRFHAVMVDEEGRFRLRGVPHGEIELGICLLDPLGPAAAPDRTVVAAPGETDLGTIELEGPATVEVHVVDGEDARPIPGAAVSCGIARSFNMPARLTDARGIASVAGLPACRKVSVTCRCHGYLILRGEGRVCRTGDAGSVSAITIALDRNPAVREKCPPVPWGGVVRDRKGATVAGALVRYSFKGTILPVAGESRPTINRISLSSGSTIGFGAKFVTDGAGRFHDEIPFSARFNRIASIVVVHPDFRPLFLEDQELAGEVEGERVLVLEEFESWIPGVVRDEAGAPLGGCVASWHSLIPRNKKGFFGTEPAETVSDGEGRFWVPYLPGTRLKCYLSREGYVTTGFSGEADAVHAGGTGRIDVVLKESVPEEEPEHPDRIPLLVRCVTEEGRPAAGIEVTAHLVRGRNDTFDRGVGSPLDYAKGRTGADGRVQVEVDSMDSVPVRCCVIEEQHFTSGVCIYYTKVTSLSPGPEENGVSLPAGQVVDLLVVFPHGAAPESLSINELPSQSVVRLRKGSSFRAFSLLEGRDGETEKWGVGRRATQWGRNQPAISVSRHVPPGRYRLDIAVPGFSKVRSEAFDVIDSAAILPKVVHLKPE